MGRKLEIVSNACIVVIAGLLAVVLIKTYLIPKPAQARFGALVPQIAAGAKLGNSIAGVDWKKNGRTLVLAISTQCHFCTDSAPFFRRLAARAGTGTKIIALLPQPVSEGRRYLRGEGVRVDQVKQLDLAGVGIHGTPTMVLVDHGGVATNVWVGELHPDQQMQVLTLVSGSAGKNPFAIPAAAAQP